MTISAFIVPELRAASAILDNNNRWDAVVALFAKYPFLDFFEMNGFVYRYNSAMESMIATPSTGSIHIGFPLLSIGIIAREDIVEIPDLFDCAQCIHIRGVCAYSAALGVMQTVKCREIHVRDCMLGNVNLEVCELRITGTARLENVKLENTHALRID